MSLFSEIDRLGTQTESLIQQANKPQPEPVKPSDCPGGCPAGSQCKNGQCTDSNTGETTDTGPTLTTQNDDFERTSTNGEDTDSGSGTDSGYVDSGKMTLEAVGQNVIKSYNKDIKPMLQNVDSRIWWGVGSAAALYIILNSNKG